MIVQAFLRWAETAKASDRAKAANALGRAYLRSPMGGEQYRAAGLAMTYLLDDPSPQVRLALAEALADSPRSPRAVVVSLAEDQPEIACTVIARSPVFTEEDLVDLVGRGDGLTRGLVAARPNLSPGVSAAIAEVGDEGEVLILLENQSAFITRFSLRRIAERFGHCGDVRSLLLDRGDLPADARHMLVAHVTSALGMSGLVRNTMAVARIGYVLHEAGEAAAIAIAGAAGPADTDALVEDLRITGRLTPAFLIHALCTGKVDFFARAITVLSGVDECRARAILATGRMYAVRALFESAGLGREVAVVFVEAVFLWRKAAGRDASVSISAILLKKFESARAPHSVLSELLGMIEKLHHVEVRLNARSYASDVSFAA